MKWRRGKNKAASAEATPDPSAHPFKPVTAANAEAVPQAQAHYFDDVNAPAQAAVTDQWGTATIIADPDPAAPEASAEPHLAAPADETETLPATDKRSGRNMLAATTVGLALLGIVLTSAWFHPLALAVVVYAACVGAVIEWRRALQRQARRISLVPILAATAGMGIATWFALAEGLAVALLVGCAGVVAWRVTDERIENTLADSLASMMTLMWIPFLASFFLLMALADTGWQRVIVVVIAIVGNDSGGLYAGMLFGKRPFAPRISPKKTWEGAIGGVTLAAVAATVVAYFLFDERWWIGTIVGVAVSIAATAGDLAESAIKRDIQVKDMSHAIPGHGGIMDRMDSALVAAPVAYVVFALLLGTT
jgi:phosphatidate cytidylyltransferase